jgi:acetyl esterase/lipase
MSKYPIHSDFKKYQNFALPVHPSLLPLVNLFLALSFKTVKRPADVLEVKKKIRGYGNGMIELTVFEPKDIGKNAPCLVYFHGGAFVHKASYLLKLMLCEYALKTPCKVVLVDYRLAPKYPFPVGLEDCYAAYEWVCANADALGVDKNKIAVGGDSAGGALAAAVCLMARDREAAAPCFQMLIYPVTDARQTTESIRQFLDTPLWNAKRNQQMWKLYLKNGVSGSREYASPAEAASLANLPNAYIEVCEFDCLRDEGKDFANSLKKSGVQVELNETAGTVHGFEIAQKSEVVRQCIGRRIQALKKAFNI